MINIYCDESSHLEHDNANAMLLGAMSCDESRKKQIYSEIRDIKIRHNISTWAEIKWTGVSPAKEEFYLDLIDYFHNSNELSFRSVVIKNKGNLNHKKYNDGDHNLWYYKAYYYLLDAIIDYCDKYCIFIDIKDTCGGPRVEKLKTVLCNNKYDFKQEVIKSIHQIDSSESEIMQLADLVIGAIGYYHNGRFKQAGSSSAKNKVVERLIHYYGRSIMYGTPRGTTKVDVFLWELRG